MRKRGNTTDRQKLLDNTYSKLYDAMLYNGITDSVVKGSGAFLCKMALVGEAPGGSEEKQGKPFVGPAGKNLDRFLSVLNVSRDDIYITNVVKWRPKRPGARPGSFVNRPPTKSEVELCSPFLFEELKIVEPKIIVTLGNVALKAVINDNTAKIGELHGKILTFSQIAVFPLYHPASIIYNRGLKEVYEMDLDVLRKVCASL